MNQNDFDNLKKLIIHVAEYYDRDIKPAAVLMMANDLKEYPLDEINQAYEKYRKADKLFKFPMPAQIIAIMCPEPSEENLAREIASKISQAVTKFGWPNADDAKNYIGEIGWRVVERRGGWSYICQNLGVSIDPMTFEAQSRELAKVAILAHNNPRYNDMLEQLSKGMRLIDYAPKTTEELDQRKKMLLDQAKKLEEK